MIRFDKEHDVFLLVDFQNDFITGSLAVKEAKKLIPVVCKYIEKFKFIIATKDWHPADHCSFVDQGGPWPPHCVQNTWGAELQKDIDKTKHIFYINKGDLQYKDSYSAFEDKFLNTLLDHMVSSAGDHNIFIGGLATDYCVKAHALDVAEKYKDRLHTAYGKINIFFLADASAAVNVEADDDKKAVEAMQEKGVTSVTFEDIQWD